MAKVTVIVPIYNVEEYLDDCLASLLNQTYKDFVVLLVDDGSPDNSRDIYDKFLKLDDRFKLLKQNNQGLGPARNNGLKATNSDYVTFVDSDDRLDENYLKTMMSIAFDSDSSVVCCEYLNIDIKGNIIGHRKKKANSETANLVDNKDKVVLSVSAWGKLYRKEHFEQLVFPPIKYEDLAVVPSITLSANKVAYTPDTLYHYRVRPGSLVRENPNDETNLIAFTMLINRMKSLGIYELYREEIAYLFVRHLLRYRIVDSWPTLSYLKKVHKYSKKNFPNWQKSFYFDSNKGVGKLKLLRYIGPYLYKLYFTLNHRLKTIKQYFSRTYSSRL
jgi:glycosyltransferase involved in cell wall biosynthesis